MSRREMTHDVTRESLVVIIVIIVIIVIVVGLGPS